MAITQEDCIAAHRAEKKRKAPTGPSSAQPPRYRLVQNTPPRPPQRNAPIGIFVFRPPQQQGGFRPPVFQQSQQFGPRPIPHNSIVGMATIDALIATVLIILPRIARNPRSLIQGRTPIRTTRARVRSKWCKSDRGELISLLLQSFPKEH